MTRFAANVVRASVGLFGASLLGLAIQVVIARALGVEAFGLYGFALAYVGLWQVLMDGGTVVLATREARRAAPGVQRALVTAKPAMILGAYVGLVAVARLAGFPPSARHVVAVLGVAAAATAVMTFGLGIFRGYEEFGVETFHLIAQRTVFGALVAVALALGAGVLGVSAAAALSSAGAAVSVVVLLHRRHDVRPGVDTPALRRHGRALFQAAGPLFAADALSQVHGRGAQLILQFARGTAEVGTYTAARRLVEGLHLLPAAFAIALFPRLVAAWREQPQRFPARLGVGLRFTAALAAAVLVGGTLWAEEIMVFLFGHRYAGSIPVFQVLLGALAVMMLNAVATLALIAAGRERAYAAVLAAAALVNIAVNLALAPGLGGVGAAWASLASEAVLLAGCLLALRRTVPGFLPVKEWLALATAAVLAFALLAAVKRASAAAAAVLTSVVLVGGFEIASPLGVLDLLTGGARGSTDDAEV